MYVSRLTLFFSPLLFLSVVVPFHNFHIRECLLLRFTDSESLWTSLKTQGTQSVSQVGSPRCVADGVGDGDVGVVSALGNGGAINSSSAAPAAPAIGNDDATNENDAHTKVTIAKTVKYVSEVLAILAAAEEWKPRNPITEREKNVISWLTALAKAWLLNIVKRRKRDVTKDNTMSALISGSCGRAITYSRCVLSIQAMLDSSQSDGADAYNILSWEQSRIFRWMSEKEIGRGRTEEAKNAYKDFHNDEHDCLLGSNFDGDKNLDFIVELERQFNPLLDCQVNPTSSSMSSSSLSLSLSCCRDNVLDAVEKSFKNCSFDEMRAYYDSQGILYTVLHVNVRGCPAPVPVIELNTVMTGDSNSAAAKEQFSSHGKQLNEKVPECSSYVYIFFFLNFILKLFLLVFF